MGTSWGGKMADDRPNVFCIKVSFFFLLKKLSQRCPKGGSGNLNSLRTSLVKNVVSKLAATWLVVHQSCLAKALLTHTPKCVPATEATPVFSCVVWHPSETVQSRHNINQINCLCETPGVKWPVPAGPGPGAPMGLNSNNFFVYLIKRDSVHSCKCTQL